MPGTAVVDKQLGSNPTRTLREPLRTGMTDTPRTCPHCNSPLRKWRVPDEASWAEEFFLACFNNDCSYYQQGWVWMKEQYNQHASYRYAFNTNTGTSLMIPVWDDNATREMLEDPEGGTE